MLVAKFQQKNGADLILKFSWQKYCDKILSIEQAAKKSWSEYTTNELKSDYLLRILQIPCEYYFQ